MSEIIATNESHVTFARALASPDKEVRDKTVKSLINYASSLREITELEMLKLWKALYYCMWLSDKAPVQMELAQAISGLLRSFKEEEIAAMYFGMFFRTMVREWTLLDQHRVNKFYTLIRLILREALSSMHKKGWGIEAVDSLLDVLEEEVLVKTPNGLRLHVADIFLQELYTVSGGDIDTDAFMRVLRPFFGAMQGCLDSSFQERVSKKIFSAFVSDFAREHRDGEEGQQLFLGVRTSAVQGMIFGIASDSDTVEKNRRKLYLLHQEFPRVTGLPFAPDDEVDEEEEEERVEKMVVERVAAASSSSSKKSIVVGDVVVEKKDKQNKKRKAESEVVAEPVVKETAVVEVVAVKKVEVVPLKKATAAVVVAEVLQVKKVVPAQAVLAPVAVPAKEEKKRKAEDSASKVIVAEAVAVAAPYIKSNTFTGAKLGYVFKKVREGCEGH